MKDVDKEAKNRLPNPIHSTENRWSAGRNDSQSRSIERAVSNSLAADASANIRSSPIDNPFAAYSQDTGEPKETAFKLISQKEIATVKKPPIKPDTSSIEDRRTPEQPQTDLDSSPPTRTAINAAGRSEEGHRDQKIVYINSSYDKLDKRQLDPAVARELQAAGSTDSARKLAATGSEKHHKAQTSLYQHLPLLTQLDRHQRQPSDLAGHRRSSKQLLNSSIGRDASKSSSHQQADQESLSQAAEERRRNNRSMEASVHPLTPKLARDATQGPVRGSPHGSHFPDLSISGKKPPAEKKSLEKSADDSTAPLPHKPPRPTHKLASSKQSLSQLLKKKPVREGRTLLLGHSSSKSYLLPDLHDAHQTTATSKSLNASMLDAPPQADTNHSTRSLEGLSHHISSLLQQSATHPPSDAAGIRAQNRQLQEALVDCQAALQSAASQGLEQRLREARSRSTLDSYHKSTVEKVLQKYDRDAELNALVIHSMDSELAKLASSHEQRSQPGYHLLTRFTHDLLQAVLAAHDQVEAASSELSQLKKQVSANNQLLGRGSGSRTRQPATPAMHENAKLLRDVSHAGALQAILAADLDSHSLELARQQEKLRELQSLKSSLDEQAAVLGLDDRDLCLTFDRLAESRSKLQAELPLLLQSLEQRRIDAQRNSDRLARSNSCLSSCIAQAESQTDLILQEAKRLAVEESQKELSFITKIAQMEREKVLQATRQHLGFTDESFLGLGDPADRPALPDAADTGQSGPGLDSPGRVRGDGDERAASVDQKSN